MGEQINANGEHVDELIVDLPHRDDVVRILVEKGVWTPPEDRADWREDRSDDLDLVLLRKLRPANGLDVLMRELRERCAAELGKNRDTIVGYPQKKAVANPSVPKVSDFEIVATGKGQGRHIGIIDTPPVDHDHLPDDLVHSDEWFEPSTEHPVKPWAGHGNFVAGRVRLGAPAAHVHMRAGLDPTTGRNDAWSVAKRIAGFRNVIGTRHVDVLNLSFGCVTEDNQPPLVMRQALKRLPSDILVVAAAGNRRNQKPPVTHIWPAAADSVVAVGATRPEDSSGDGEFSMRQPWVNCTAPGVRVQSTYLDGVQVELQDADPARFSGLAEWSGTSFAAAYVSGMVAARMAATGERAREAWENLLDDGTSQIARYKHGKS